MEGAWERDVVEVRGVDAAEWKQARAREPKEEEKENRCVLGLEKIAWEKVKACCSVGPRERSGWGEGEGEEEEAKE